MNDGPVANDARVVSPLARPSSHAFGSRLRYALTDGQCRSLVRDGSPREGAGECGGHCRNHGGSPTSSSAQLARDRAPAADASEQLGEEIQRLTPWPHFGDASGRARCAPRRSDCARYRRCVADAPATGASSDLPVFSAPPVVEALLGVEFQPIPRFGAVALAELATRWRSKYPRVVEQPLIPMSPPIGQPGHFPSLVVNLGAPGIRFWLLRADDDSRLLQMQRDRLILNWRRTESDYPHYDILRPEVAEALGVLATYVDESFQTQPVPTAVEVSYVNEVAIDEPHILSRILRAGPVETHSLGLPQTERLSQVFAAKSIGDAPATLALNAEAPGREPGTALLTFTYRGAVPTRATEADILATMDIGHRHVVLGFDESTTDEMHEVWGRSN